MRSYCSSCKKRIEPLKTGYPSFGEPQRLKCPSCHNEVYPDKNYFWILLLIGLSGIFLLFVIDLSSAYSSTVTVSDTNLGQIRSDFYGVNDPRFTLNRSIPIGDSTTSEIKGNLSNSTWHMETFQNSGMNHILIMPFLSTQYSGFQNGNAESWNINRSRTINKTDSTCNTPDGIGCSTYGNGASYFSEFKISTDAHSGTYSVNLSNTGNAGNQTFSTLQLVLESNHYYNISVWVKSKNDTKLRAINETDATTLCIATGSGSGNWEKIQCGFNYTSSGHTIRIDIGYLTGGESGLWDDFVLLKDGVETTYWYSGNITYQRDELLYLKNIGGTAGLRLDYMPSFLANITLDCYNTTRTCTPNNYTLWGNILVDYINKLTNNSENLNVISYAQIHNEPYLSGEFLCNLPKDDPIRSVEYNKIYNQSWISLKSAFPSLSVVGPTAYVESSNLLKGFLGNFSNQTDGITYHPYILSPDTGGLYSMYNHTIFITDLCTQYGANCSRLIYTEWQPSEAEVKNTTSNYPEYKSTMSSAYSTQLNLFPSRITNAIFEWSDVYKYVNPNYREKPQKYGIVSEPQLDNELTPAYNVTKHFATTHRAGINSVYNSSSSNSSLKVVVSKDSSKTYITLTNTLNENATTIIDTSALTQTGYYLKDVETGQNYTSNNEIFNLGNISAYGVKTLSTEYYNISINFAQAIGVVRGDFYGANTHGEYLGNSTRIDTNIDGTVETYANISWNRNLWEEAGLKRNRFDMDLQRYYTSSTARTLDGSLIAGVYSKQIDIAYANATGNKVNLIIDYTPSWLANVTNGYCNSSASGGNKTCTPNNYTQWCTIVNDFINWSTNNSQYLSTIELQFWNEPNEMGAFLNNMSMSNTDRAYIYDQFYNITYDCVKAVYPTIPFGGGGWAIGDPWVSMRELFIKELGNKSDIIYLHKYLPTSDNKNYYDTFDEIFSLIYQNCSYYGVSCNRIVVSEFNIKNSTIMNETNELTNQYKKEISLAYTSALSKYPDKISMMLYQWSSQYAEQSTYYEYKPYQYSMISNIFNVTYTPYNITKLFAHYMASEGTIKNSTSLYNGVKIVASTKSNANSIILTNTENNDKSFPIQVLSSASTFIDVNSGELYTVSNNQISNIELSEYEVKVLTEPTFREQGGDWYADNYLGEEIRELTDEEAAALGLVDTHQGLGSTCDQTTISFYTLILNFAALGLIGFTFYWGFKEGVWELDLQKVLIMGIGLIVGVILFQISGDNLAIGSCS